MIAQRCDAWAALAEEKEVDLSRGPDGTAAVATLVPGDLDQILDNLLANALEATPEGGRIRVWTDAARDGRTSIHVTDDGPGMSGAERHRAFDRFWQGPRSSRGRSGLGLAIVRQLAARNDLVVELHPVEPHGLDAVVIARTASPASPTARRP